MSWRAIVAYYAITVLLGLNLARVWSASARPEATQQATTLEPLLSLAPASIDRLALRAGGTTVRAERRARRWSLTQPAGAVVSSDLIDALLDALAHLTPVEVVTEDRGRSGEFGLDPPLTVVEVEASASGKRQALQLGLRNPTRTAVYGASAGDQRLYLLGLNGQYYVDLIFEQVASSARSDRRR